MLQKFKKDRKHIRRNACKTPKCQIYKKKLDTCKSIVQINASEIFYLYQNFAQECFSVLDKVYNHEMGEAFRHEIKSKDVSYF